MENDNIMIVVRELFAEVLEDGECAKYIVCNQPSASRDFKIRCRGCGGFSNPSTIFLDQGEYNRAVERLTEEEKKILLHFLHFAGGLDRLVDLIGGCMQCGQTLRAKVQYVYH